MDFYLSVTEIVTLKVVCSMSATCLVGCDFTNMCVLTYDRNIDYLEHSKAICTHKYSFTMSQNDPSKIALAARRFSGCVA